MRAGYTVKEIFKTLQGEGFHTGTAAVFCRFSGCNLWSGREEDRASSRCNFCDTDFVGGARFTLGELVRAIEDAWGPLRKHRFVVLTGGEPLLQVDEPLVLELRERGFFIAVETNGTIEPPDKVDWITVSPKGDVPLHPRLIPSEIKLVYPQANCPPYRHDYSGIRLKYIQPKDGADAAQNLAAAIAYVGQNPHWRLSLQTHKLIGIR